MLTENGSDECYKNDDIKERVQILLGKLVQGLFFDR